MIGLIVRPILSDLLEDPNSTEIAISIIISTTKEADNIGALLSRISQISRGVPAEVVFVGDSTDHTPEVIRSLQDQFPSQVTLDQSS